MGDLPVFRAQHRQRSYSECGAYINCYSGLDSIGWRCSICGAYSEYVQNQIRKYSKPAIRETQPELQKHIFEALCPSYDSQSVREGYQVMSGPFPAPRDGHHVVIFVVDVSTTEDFLDHVKLAMSAALEVLPPHTLVGLISAADHIGLWDVQSASPAVRNVPVFDDGAIMCPLEDAMPLRALIAPLDTFGAQISTAVDQLQPAPLRGRLALGSIVNAVLDYLHVLVDEIPPETPSAAQNPTANALPPLGPTKLVLLLNSPPTTGSGAVTDPPAAGPSPTHMNPTMPHFSTPPAQQQQRYTPPYSQLGAGTGASLALKIPEASRSFYENLATLAAALGVCVDTFAVGPSPVGLAAHAPLCEFTGGVCFHYSSLEASAVPQDLCRRLQTPQALSGLLRVRCCPELRVARAYGRLVADSEHDHLYHCVACDPYDAMAFDLALTSKHGFRPQASGKATHPVVQIAFQYSMLIYKKQRPTDDGQEPTENPNSRVYELQRRLRVLTIAPAVAKTERQLYESFFVEPSLALLMHKALRLAQRQSVSDSRQLLQEWLVMFLANWHQNNVNDNNDKKNTRDRDNASPHASSNTRSPSAIDATLESAPGTLPALVPATYALLRSAPLSPLVGASQSDRTQALSSLWTSLAPPELMRSIYPLFVSTRDLNEVDFKRSTLERATIARQPEAIFLLDAYHHVLVMYGRSCAAEFPPPQNSSLRATVNSMRHKRRIVPEVTFCRETDAQALALDEHLINEPLPAAALDDTTAVEACTLGYSGWIQYLQKETQALMQDAR